MKATNKSNKELLNNSKKYTRPPSGYALGLLYISSLDGWIDRAFFLFGILLICCVSIYMLISIQINICDHFIRQLYANLKGFKVKFTNNYLIWKTLELYFELYSKAFGI